MEIEAEKEKTSAPQLMEYADPARAAATPGDRQDGLVLGTEHQDPNEKQPVAWRSLLILGLAALGQAHNIALLHVSCPVSVSGATKLTKLPYRVAPAANAYSIAGPLGATTGQRIWIVQAAGVPAVATGPMLARFSDIYGRRYVILICYALFIVAAIVCMTAKTVRRSTTSHDRDELTRSGRADQCRDCRAGHRRRRCRKHRNYQRRRVRGHARCLPHMGAERPELLCSSLGSHCFGRHG